MSDDETRSASTSDAGDDDQVSRIAQLAREAMAVRPVDGNPHLYAVAKDVRILSETSIRFPGAKAEEFIERTETFTDPRSYATYISEYGGDDTCVLIDADSARSRAILNYVPKPARRRALAKSGVNYYPCTWQAELALRPTDTWRRLVEFSNGEALLPEQSFVLISLLAKNGTFEDADDEGGGFEGRRAQRDGGGQESTEMLERLFGAKYIRDDVLSKLDPRAEDGRWIFSIRVAVHRGSRPHACMVLVVMKNGEAEIQLLDQAGCERLSADLALADVRRVLRGNFGSEFNTYEADLAEG